MEPIPSDLALAALAARDRLAGSARRAAAAAGNASQTPQPLMASAARQVVFADALLAALHARLEALKGVTK